MKISAPMGIFSKVEFDWRLNNRWPHPNNSRQTITMTLHRSRRLPAVYAPALILPPNNAAAHPAHIFGSQLCWPRNDRSRPLATPSSHRRRPDAPHGDRGPRGGRPCRSRRPRGTISGRGDRGDKAGRLLGILAPTELGGEEAVVGDVVDICYALGRGCASTAMIFAMHQIMVAILVRHAGESGVASETARPRLREQWLMASIDYRRPGRRRPARERLRGQHPAPA